MPRTGLGIAPAFTGMIYNTAIGMFYALGKRLTPQPPRVVPPSVHRRLPGRLRPALRGFSDLVPHVYPVLGHLGILQDGYQNLHGPLTSMMEATPKTLDTSDPHPVPALINARLAQLPWVREMDNRTREEGQYFHVDAYVVPHRADGVTADDLIDARELGQHTHWRIHDVSVVPVRELDPLLHVDVADLDDVEGHDP